jgi:hypothetical protein
MIKPASLALVLMLQGCGGDNSAPTPPPINPPFSGQLSIQSAWAITQSSNPRALSNGNFAFQSARSAGQECTAPNAGVNGVDCKWDSYVELPLPVSVNGAQTYSLTYTIFGDNPVWVNDSPNNTCGGPATLRLFLHKQGDIGADPSARWYSGNAFAQELKLGTNTTNVPFVLANWISTQGTSTDALGFSTAMTHLGSVGFVFGGGCFAGHGVAVSSGSASFQLQSATIQ